MSPTHSPPAETSVEPSTLRRTMGRFTTGVAVVTTADDEPHGMTVNSLTSVSLDPPLILISLTIGARTTDAVAATGSFAISILSARQDAIAMRFARRGEDHFAGLPLEYGDHHIPIVPGALAHVECEVQQEIPAGDHVLFLGRAIATCDRDGEPLVFHGGRFIDSSGHGPEAPPWFF
ncbi:flavin reductase family protein [Haloactinomyces albus]|uniref:Flavin reductase (DIM6/NTAB) family NADH-FMN oxidoreductase RutF n=1 Tax=Haloactinomyces albus TaxID=1352928 RepID=A0AAE3ZIC9_9ACTN|nr:flavin reductase family protein [Haloactinomyces albus]MDR7303757.1 flavin reductase (DIM6/NTAB) family NADH-FMN oxidoreductase RutF [Haloactinomyces albus]